MTHDEIIRPPLEIPDKSAIFYMQQQDLEDLVVALGLAISNPKAGFMKNSKRFPRLLKQLKDALK